MAQGLGIVRGGGDVGARLADRGLSSSGAASTSGTLATAQGPQVPVFVKELVAGGIAGGFAKSAVAPFERCKILFQTGSAKGSVFSTIQGIYRREGIFGLYKGNGAMVVRVVPYAAFHFMAYEQYRRNIIGSNLIQPSPVIDLVAGAVAGATAVVLTYPLDLVRTRLAWQHPGQAAGAAPGAGFRQLLHAKGVENRAYKGIVDAVQTIVRVEGGVRGLYQGIGPTLLGILPYAGLKFYCYESLKLKHKVTTDAPPTLPYKLFYGATAGLVGQTLTYPLDVVRRNMQVQGQAAAATPGMQVYDSTIDGLTRIFKQQGWRKLFAGLSLNYLKVVPSTAVGFAVYDGIKAMFHVPAHQF